MARLPYIPQYASEPRALLETIRKRRGGTLLNLDRILLHSPPVAEGWNRMLGAVRTELALSPKLKELAMCVVAVLNGAEYEWGHHAPLFVAEGGTPEQRDALREPERACEDTQRFDAAERAAIRLALEMTRTVSVREETFAAVRAALPGDREVFELVLTIAAYNMVSRVLVAVGIDPE